MGVIESEFLTSHFENLVHVVVSSAAIPAPTFQVLGGDRLVASLTWPSLTIADPPPPDLQPPPGFALARAAVRIGHASIAELSANAAAMAFTDATAWLFVGVSEAPHRLTMDIARIDIPGKPPSALFSPPLRLAAQPTTIDLPGGVVALGQAILVADGVCTVRFITSTDENLFAPAANRVQAVSEGWAIHVSGQVIVEQLLGQLRAALQGLGPDLEVEIRPHASWSFGFGLPIPRWGAFGGFTVKKVDACADVSISIEVSANVVLLADGNAGTLTTMLHISSDASDWDSFRCWLASGGLLAAVFLPPLGIDSLAAVGIRVKHEGGNAVSENAPHGEWTKVSGGTTSVNYEMVSKLPDQGPTSNVHGEPTIGPDGLLISGELNPIPLAVHVEPHFTPDGGVIDGTWVGAFSCQKGQWSQKYELPSIEVVDEALVAGKPFARLPVKIFPTSMATPAGLFSLEVVSGGFDQTVNVVCSAQAADHPNSPFLNAPAAHPKPSGSALLHTTAGLKRFDLGAIPPARTPPDELHLIPMRVNCRNFGNDWLDPRVIARWLVDPPGLSLEPTALRQWQLTISEVPRGTRIAVHGYRHGELTQRLASVTASETGQIAVEVVTDAETELAIVHTLRRAPPGARLTQRWLLPTAVLEFPGTATGLLQDADGVHVVGSDRLVSFRPLSKQAEPTASTASPPFSLTLPDGKIAAIYGNSLVIATAHGGASARAARRI